MEGNYFYVKEMSATVHHDLHGYVDSKVNEILKSGKTVAVKVEEYKHPRTLTANALYWVWMDDLAKLFNRKGMKIEMGAGVGVRDYAKEDCHDLMRSMFLGLVTKKLSKTNITTLRSTRTLNSSEFCFYMEQIQGWSIDKLKHHLPDPIESQYRKYIEAQNG